MNCNFNQEDLLFSNAYDNIFIPQRFSQRVTDHVILNYLEDNHFFQPPLYLAIEGTPGQGKTMQVIAACNKKKIAVKYISASELSGKKEAESRDVLKRIYSEALTLFQSGIYVCILIDDFHMGIAITDEKINKTINSNLLIGYMMNLAQSSFKQKIPIILTGNDFSQVYPALIRDGRADMFFWEPTHDEKFGIIKSIYKPILQNDDLENLQNFYTKYQSHNIAFFVQLINDFRRRLLSDEISKIDAISSTVLQELSLNIKNRFNKITLSQLNEFAESREKDRERSVH